jgi:hypothetical protein
VERLYHLKRQILDLLVVTDGLYDPLARIASVDPLVAAPPVYNQLALAIDRLGRVVARTRMLSDLITAAIDANLTQVSLQQNEDMRKISAWVAIAAVPTLIAGIYGMKFEELPELRRSLGYPAVLLLMATICTLLYRHFRRSAVAGLLDLLPKRAQLDVVCSGHIRNGPWIPGHVVCCRPSGTRSRGRSIRDGTVAPAGDTRGGVGGRHIRSCVVIPGRGARSFRRGRRRHHREDLAHAGASARPTRGREPTVRQRAAAAPAT